MYPFIFRFMLSLAAVPSIIMFIGFLFMPETPRWLIFHGKPQKARRVLYKLRHPSEVEKEYKEIVADYEEYTKLKLGEGNVSNERKGHNFLKRDTPTK